MQSAPFVFYCHPYECDPLEFKEIPVPIPKSVQLHQGLGRRWFQTRFKAFLHQFGGRRMEDLLASETYPDFDLDAYQKNHQLNS